MSKESSFLRKAGKMQKNKKRIAKPTCMEERQFQYLAARRKKIITYIQILLLRETHCAGYNSNLLLNSNISKMMRGNIAF